MLNQVILIGRLTHDPQIKTLDDGKKVSEITLAVQRSFKNLNGEYDTDFIKCILWSGLAESIDSYCKKGTMIAVKGRIQTRSYEAEDEQKMKFYEVIVDRVTYLSNQTKKSLKESHLDDE